MGDETKNQILVNMEDTKSLDFIKIEDFKKYEGKIKRVTVGDIIDRFNKGELSEDTPIVCERITDYYYVQSGNGWITVNHDTYHPALGDTTDEYVSHDQMYLINEVLVLKSHY